MSLAKKHKLHNDYIALIERFPLRTLKSDRELEVASRLISEVGMKGKKRTPGENDYLDALCVLVGDYEKRSPRIQRFLSELPKISPREILESFLEDHELSQSELARRIGCTQPVISDFLTGKRGLSKNVMVKLGDYFAVNPALFLPELDEGGDVGRIRKSRARQQKEGRVAETTLSNYGTKMKRSKKATVGESKKRTPRG